MGKRRRKGKKKNFTEEHLANASRVPPLPPLPPVLHEHNIQFLYKKGQEKVVWILGSGSSSVAHVLFIIVMIIILILRPSARVPFLLLLLLLKFWWLMMSLFHRITIRYYSPCSVICYTCFSSYYSLLLVFLSTRQRIRIPFFVAVCYYYCYTVRERAHKKYRSRRKKG